MASTGHVFSLIFVIWNIAFVKFSSGSNPDVVCIAEHCSRQSMACLENTDCRENMECITRCGMSNMTCLNICLNTYENPIYDAMMQCMVIDHHCMKLEPPNPSFRCSPPKSLVRNFTLSQLSGTWYIVRGLNKEYDCFDCTVSTFAPSKVSKNYTLSETFNVQMVNGSIRNRLVIAQVEQKSPSSGGLLDLTNDMMGLTVYEKWQVLDYQENGHYVVFYYCGHMNSNWWYEGSLVFSRSQVLAPADVATVAAVIKSTTGHTLDEYCTPKTTDCQK